MDFTKQDIVESLVQKYSEFITFPIKLYKKTEKTVEVEDEDEDEDDEDTDSEDAAADEDDGLEVEEEEEDEPPKTETITTYDWHRVNSNVAIWARDKDDVTEDEYNSFSVPSVKALETLWPIFTSKLKVRLNSNPSSM